MFTLTRSEVTPTELLPAIGDRPAVTVTFNPQPSLLSLRAARKAVLEVLRAGGLDVEDRAADAFTATLIRHNIREWSGIGDEHDQPVAPTPDTEILDADGAVIGVEPGTISFFLAEPRLVEAADREWVLPWALADAEKNGLSLSQNGTSAGAMPEASIAGSVVAPASSDAAVTTTDAPPVRTSATKPARKKAKRPGG